MNGICRMFLQLNVRSELVMPQMVSRVDELESKVASILEDRKEMERKLRQSRRTASLDINLMLKQAESVNGISVIANQIDVSDVDELRHYGDQIRNTLSSGVAVLACVLQVENFDPSNSR